jgi:hypothetical protein
VLKARQDLSFNNKNHDTLKAFCKLLEFFSKSALGIRGLKVELD